MISVQVMVVYYMFDGCENMLELYAKKSREYFPRIALYREKKKRSKL